MDCKGAEKHILRLFDDLISEEDKGKLKRHLKECPDCREKEKQYGNIFNILQKEKVSEPLPNFEMRLMSKLKERREYEPWPHWRQWSFRVVPVSLVLIFFLAAAMIFFLPEQINEMSQTEALLLRDINPLSDTSLLLDEKNVENKNMMLIFYASDDNKSVGRNFQ